MESPHSASPYLPPESTSQPPTTPKPSLPTPWFMKVLIGGGLLLALAVVALNAYFLGYLQVQKKYSNAPSEQPAPIANNEQTACTLEAMICPDGTTVGRTGPNCEFEVCPTTIEGWEELSTAEYTLKYPSNFALTEQDDMNVLTATGPTQTEATELYDGVAMMIRWQELDGMTLEEYVDQQITAVGSDGIATLVSGKETVTIGNYEGFSYVVEGLGVFTKVFIMGEESDKTLQIEYLVEDPSNQGFQDQVDQILSTIQLQ